jgi:Flp pilus assembly protein TadD
LVQQHLDLAYKLCSDGMAAAQEATALAPADGEAWQTSAAVYYHCGRFTDAIAAAQQGLAHAPDNPALHFFLGSALWEANQRDEGRDHLIRAADLAPNSQWRERAEELLQMKD